MATTAYDLKTDTDGGLIIDENRKDFIIAPSDTQHIREVMIGSPGWNKEFPLSGFNPYSRINSRVSKQKNIQDASLALAADGYKKGTGGIDFELTVDGEFNIKILDLYRP